MSVPPLVAPLLAEALTRLPALARRPFTVWLDSGRRMPFTGRWSLVNLPPALVLRAPGGGGPLEVIVPGGGSPARFLSGDAGAEPDPAGRLSALRALGGGDAVGGLGRAFDLLGLAPWPAAEGGDDGSPFSGGLVGFVSYDFGRRFERWGRTAAPGDPDPDYVFLVCDAAVAVDHDRGEAWLVQEGRPPGVDPAAEGRLLSARAAWVGEVLGRTDAPVGDFALVEEPVSNLGPERYRERVAAIRGRIGAGEVYQANLSQRLIARIEGDPLAAYLRVREASPAPYGAFVRLPGLDVASNSPELFLRARGDTLSGRPIKGTRPRAARPAEDDAARADLAASGKDRAELTMIVDLVRNDFGRLAVPGGVRVPVPWTMETHATVHHGVAEVEARLRAGTSPLDWFAAAFPPGSVTGCPKIRAMSLLDGLEPERRGVYCGAIGYASTSGRSEWSLAIRTATFRDGAVRIGVGGGVVWDSDPEAEWLESLAKARAWLTALGTRLRAAQEGPGGPVGRLAERAEPEDRD